MFFKKINYDKFLGTWTNQKKRLKKKKKTTRMQ